LCGNAQAASRAQVEAWLSSSPRIVHEKPPPSSTGHGIYVSVRGVQGSTGWVDPGVVQVGLLAGGQPVMIVPIASGGSGGVFTTLLFTTLRGATRFVAPLQSASGHLDVYLDGGRIVVKRPVYKANDPNCCPSGFRYERATLRGTTLVVLDRWNE
jgi:hypothetical protein